MAAIGEAGKELLLEVGMLEEEVLGPPAIVPDMEACSPRGPAGGSVAIASASMMGCEVMSEVPAGGWAVVPVRMSEMPPGAVEEVAT